MSKSLKKMVKKIFKVEEEAKAPYWEYYNRYSFVAKQLKAMGTDAMRVLDVGGMKSLNLFEKFGIRDVTALNISEDSDICASAAKMPLPEKSFDAAICIDTLEHIPYDLRNCVAGELIRVARKAVIIVAPIDSKENRLAEDIVYKFLKSGYIEEHKKFGLVNFDAIKENIKTNPRVVSIDECELDNLMYWAAMMIGDKVEPSHLYQELYFLENKFHPRRKALTIHIR